MKIKKQKLRKKLILFILITIAIMGGLFVYFLSSQKEDTEVLVFYHWWTSSGEQAALNALIEVFSEQNPDVTVIPTPVSGGGGFELIEIIKPLVFAREAPDAFQMHAGYETKPYFEAGLLESVDNIWKSECLEKVIPEVVQSMCKFNGHYYSVPIDIHRYNLVWYNKELLDKNNINPAELTTWDSFFEACDRLKGNGVEYPVQIGRDWTEAHLFESIIASQGIDFYEDWVNGKITSPNNEMLLNSLKIFKKYMSYANPDYSSLEWNEVTERIINREGAFNVMGDWANGEFKVSGMVYNKDYGTFTVPGTGKMYGLVIDTFQRPKYIKHATNLERWLKVVGSKEGQDAFNPWKGSISARIDTNISKYDLYQKLAIFDFISAQYMLPSVVHGSGAPESFRVKLNKIISEFATDLDINKTAKTLTDYTKSISKEFTTEWQLN